MVLLVSDTLSRDGYFPIRGHADEMLRAEAERRHRQRERERKKMVKKTARRRKKRSRAD